MTLRRQLTLKAPPIICSRRQFQMLADDSHDISYLFFPIFWNMLKNLSSTAVMIGASRVNIRPTVAGKSKRRFLLTQYILGKKRSAAYENQKHCVLNELQNFICYLCFAMFSAAHSSHCFIELSQSKTVYWSIFYFPSFHMHTHSIQINMCTISQRASNTFNQVVEVKRFEGVFLCRKVC